MTDGDGGVCFHYTRSAGLTSTPQNGHGNGEEVPGHGREVRVPISSPFNQEHAAHSSLFYREQNPAGRHRHNTAFPDGEEEDVEEIGPWSPGPPGPVGGGVSGNMRADPVTDPADMVSEDEEQPYPGLAPVVFFWAKQTTRPRSWCLRMYLV
ncbi:hypothetical protein UPYG_G00094410 [Umbra pygmaea]|uniref:Uncharacterized protein n=1 Tax=Umbra pygmaea TaxID=75934 RepID=A0ABD0WZI3_UMBPY